jgi:mannose-6-phosphate isomerase
VTLDAVRLGGAGAPVCASKLEPIFVPRIWGTHTLAPLFPDPPAGGQPIGEIWLTGETCRFASGPFAGRTLGDAWPDLPAEWTGTQLHGQPRIPLLVKFIFAEEYLSVQVHPDDAYAARHEQAAGGVGKTEMWCVIDARDAAEVRVGLRPEVTRESLERAIRDGNADNCLASLPLHKGDAVFVPAGTAHTIGPGLVLCEIQEHSDLTYRVYDYNRLGADGKPRALHVEKALEVMRFGSQIGGRVTPQTLASDEGERKLLAACHQFAVERWTFSSRRSARTSRERFELLIVTEGAGKLSSQSASADYAAGQGWFLPAALGEFEIAPRAPTTILRAYVPDFTALQRELAAQGVSPGALAGAVFP